MSTHTIEYLHHFTCSSCMGWWSIASHQNFKPKELYCPHCGTKNKFKQIDIRTGDKV